MKLDYSALSAPVTVIDQASYLKWRRLHVTSPSLLNRELPLRVLAASFLLLFALFAASLGLAQLARRFLNLPEAFVGILYVLLPTILILVIIIVVARRQVASVSNESVMRYKFARQNGLIYSEDVPDPDYGGILLGRGRLRRLTNAYTFRDGTLIGNYRYYDQSGRYEELREWIVASVPLPGRLPHMLLDSRANNLFGGKLSNLPSGFREQKLSLEGDFDTYFTLYTAEEHARDALYILTPDVMAAMIDFGQAYDMEIINGRLLFYTDGSLDLALPSDISQLVAATSAIRREVSHQAGHYSDEPSKSGSEPILNF